MSWSTQNPPLDPKSMASIMNMQRENAVFEI